MKKLTRVFYRQDTLTVAKELVGKILVHEYDGKRALVRITETEAYIGAIDKACHCYGGRVTERTSTMFMDGGTAYVYFIYGMYYCFNVVTGSEGVGNAVLIRAGVPVGDEEITAQNRFGKSLSELSKYQRSNMANGPGKLCKALNITKAQNRADLTGGGLYVADDGFSDFSIYTDKRVNIDYAEEAADFPWRFIMK